MKSPTKPHAIIYICQPLKHELAHSLGLNYYSMNEFKNTPVGQYIDVNDKKDKILLSWR